MTCISPPRAHAWGAGWYRTDPLRLAASRAAIDDERTGTGQEAVLATLEASGWERGGDRVKTSPRGTTSVFVRKSPGRPGATKVQIAERHEGQDVVLEHVGTAHDEAELAALMAVARSKLYPGQGELPLEGIAVEAIALERAKAEVARVEMALRNALTTGLTAGCPPM